MTVRKIITLFEHQQIPYRSVEALPRGPAQLNSLLDEIERLNRACGVEILHLGRKELRAGSLVGVLRVGEITFEILPKIDAPSRIHHNRQGEGRQSEAMRSAARQSAARNLLAMLNTAFDLPLYPTPAAELDENTAAWFELLTRMFASALILQVETGLSQGYAVREEALPVMRGRWDIQRQLLQNGAAQHQFHSIYDELTADIPLNQVFRYTVEMLLLLSQDAGSRAMLNSLRNWLQIVSLPAEVQPAFLDQVQFTRLNERFRPAFQLARLFLTGSILQMTAGKIPAAAFVFDMNLLFERFTAAFIEHHRQSIFPEAWEGLRLQVQSEGSRLYLARSAGRPQVLLRPDLILWPKEGKPPLLVADTKYKVLDMRSIDPGDIYQMLAYSLRLDCPRALLLYPQAAPGKPVRRVLEIGANQTKVFAVTLNLRSPLDPPDGLSAELREIFQFASA